MAREGRCLDRDLFWRELLSVKCIAIKKLHKAFHTRFSEGIKKAGCSQNEYQVFHKCFMERVMFTSSRNLRGVSGYEGNFLLIQTVRRDENLYGKGFSASHRFFLDLKDWHLLFICTWKQWLGFTWTFLLFASHLWLSLVLRIFFSLFSFNAQWQLSLERVGGLGCLFCNQDKARRPRQDRWK